MSKNVEKGRLLVAVLAVVDESGDDYLYPASHFMAVNLSARIVNALVAA